MNGEPLTTSQAFELGYERGHQHGINRGIDHLNALLAAARGGLCYIGDPEQYDAALAHLTDTYNAAVRALNDTTTEEAS